MWLQDVRRRAYMGALPKIPCVDVAQNVFVARVVAMLDVEIVLERLQPRGHERA